MKGLNFPEPTDEEFERIFMHILTKGKMDNTYKFAFARFLLKYSKYQSKTHVDFSTIAEYYLKYYWPQICNSKLRQSAKDHIKKPEIIKILEKEFDKPYYHQTFDKIKQQEPVKIANCVKNIAKKCFEHVTYAFQNVKVGAKSVDKAPMFFEYKITKLKKRPDRKKKTPLIDRDYGINLNPYAISFFKRYNVSLNNAVTLEWARFLEKVNLGVPKLIAKIEDKKPRGGLGIQREALAPVEKNCFYCETPLESMKAGDIEHVIPFAYVRENEMWNLTRACKQCNCKKLGSLPEPKERWLGELFKRNKEYRNEIVSTGKKRKKLLDESLKRLGDEHESIISLQYDNAIQQGFLPITMP